jgi:hypothetical protein
MCMGKSTRAIRSSPSEREAYPFDRFELDGDIKGNYQTL